jgi:hypothetical protein
MERENQTKSVKQEFSRPALRPEDKNQKQQKNPRQRRENQTFYKLLEDKHRNAGVE